jgi:RNA polymerase sigma-70 factor, ECF subfamily
MTSQPRARPASETRGTVYPWIERFISQTRAWLIRQALGICASLTDAEDLVQEAFLRFVKTFGEVPTLPSEPVCRSWLITTMTNLFFDQCRRQRVRTLSASDPAFIGEGHSPPESTPRPSFDTLTDQQFAKAMQALRPPLRDAFELHLRGLNYAEIASALKISKGAVGKRLHDARVKLRELLKPYATGAH